MGRNLEHYLDLGHVCITKVGWASGELKARVYPGRLPGPDCKTRVLPVISPSFARHVKSSTCAVRNCNLCGIYQGLYNVHDVGPQSCLLHVSIYCDIQFI